jgi:hypothetical protein
MTDTYKATPECWEWQEKWANKKVPNEDSRCFLELRARVEALEAQANHIGDSNKMVPPPVATDEDLKQTWLQAATLTQGNRAIYNLGIKHGQDRSREVALFNDHEHQWDKESRAAILEVKRGLRARGWKEFADLPEQEAGR